MILGATFYWMEGNENKEQPIIKRDYLPDGIVALENAQWIAIAQNQNAINFDHIFWWSYGVIGKISASLLLHQLLDSIMPKNWMNIICNGFKI